jgi:putative transposase
MPLSAQFPHFLCAHKTALPGKIQDVNNNAAHSRNLRTGRCSEPNRIYFVTSTCYDRQKYFSSHTNAQILLDEFNRPRSHTNCVSLAHVVMPDHFHWLVQIDREKTLHEVVRKLKGRSARRINLARQAPARVWQPGFHDHAVRVEEDLKNLANYLIQNPLRAGLVSDVEDYQYWGSVWHKRKHCRG